ncbi:helix-turn-helix domain-containing protein [Kitasatospora viridis]|uniref:DNA-binding PucR family transcriptional regulator n=1 Tax=Kitasatospora viridis TaxID=281105 RepID=A0A561SDZ9_9ACTN|nr:helix-turn-helix domain-containing protein [Kitasatospora viridis]TWF73091.1 DNA-binding PucR family transcriptional regulator [Kitasatospora viridis]
MPPPITSTAAHLRRLLELLTEDAPVEELGAVTAEARRTLPPEELAELDRAAAAALRIRRMLRQHQRRERELSALFDTASDLAALRELDDVLRAIVHRARLLLGTDTAYLTLPDEEAGDTYMRVTAGSISPLFQRLRLSLGDGLGGLVAQTARPYVTPDYRTDQRFHHTRGIDAGVLDEGLVAILGVPLLLGSSGGGSGQVIGVLFAADRSPRSFSSDEIALLCSLAAHAAIAIDTAKALADTNAALAELAEANTLVQAHAAAIQHAEKAHEQLTDLVLRGGDLSELAGQVGELLGAVVTVHDPDGRHLAAPEAVPEPAGLALAVAESRSSGRALRTGGRWVCAVLAGHELLGSLVLHRDEELDDANRRVFERASVVAGLLLLMRRTVAETENRISGELLSDLLTAPHRDPDGLAERASRLGVDLGRPYVVLVAEPVGQSLDRLLAAARRRLFGQPGLTAQHHGTVVLLVPADGADAGRVGASVAAQLGGPAAAVTVAAAGPAAGPQPIATAHAEAVRCLRAMKVLGRTGGSACAADLGFLGVLLADAQDVDGFVGDTLRPLLDYDARRGTDLVRTLRTYFDCGGSLTRARESLHIHVNTVVQRLERIQALLGPDWNSPARALELQLALKLQLLTDGDALSP